MGCIEHVRHFGQGRRHTETQPKGGCLAPKTGFPKAFCCQWGYKHNCIISPLVTLHIDPVHSSHLARDTPVVAELTSWRFSSIQVEQSQVAALEHVGSLGRLRYTKWNRFLIHLSKYTCVYLPFMWVEPPWKGPIMTGVCFHCLCAPALLLFGSRDCLCLLLLHRCSYSVVVWGLFLDYLFYFAVVSSCHQSLGSTSLLFSRQLYCHHDWLRLCLVNLPCVFESVFPPLFLPVPGVNLCLISRLFFFPHLNSSRVFVCFLGLACFHWTLIFTCSSFGFVCLLRPIGLAVCPPALTFCEPSYSTIIELVLSCLHLGPHLFTCSSIKYTCRSLLEFRWWLISRNL